MLILWSNLIERSTPKFKLHFSIHAQMDNSKVFKKEITFQKIFNFRNNIIREMRDSSHVKPLRRM